ncbi:hypothetical protein FS749_015323 [Ceratobasidium sp. UAMH 11750]|nr:hypothetical protein FS749_015323 [Ceratobasidium sp. UAMH 11750]
MDQSITLPDTSTPTEPAEMDDPGINPEDLPFENPENEETGSEDGIGDNDGWWEQELPGEVSPEDEDDCE